MRYAQIRSTDISNGEGIGVSLFVQGCPFHCKGCFNSETWDFNGGEQWTTDKFNEFITLAGQPFVKRISILGGEPLCGNNLSEVFSLVKEIRSTFPQKNIWLYTGYTWEGIMCSVVTTDFNPERDLVIDMRKQVIHNIDILVDGRYEENERDLSLAFRGSRNQRIIDVQASLKQGKVVLYME